MALVGLPRRLATAFPGQLAGALIKLFLRTGNARRVLFLVDRLELEDQAYKAFISYLKSDYKTVIYKESLDDWRNLGI